MQGEGQGFESPHLHKLVEPRGKERHRVCQAPTEPAEASRGNADRTEAVNDGPAMRRAVLSKVDKPNTLDFEGRG